MPQPAPQKFLLPFLLVIAVFGVIIVGLFLLQPNIQVDPLPLRRPLISTLYSVVCILGIIAAFYPNRCRIMFQKPNDPKNPNTNPPLNKGTGVAAEQQTSASYPIISGHHPGCEKFTANRITFMGLTLCASCSGLLIGAIIALGIAALFSLGFIEVGCGSLWVFAVGAGLMLLGLAQIELSGYFKAAANALFVIGSSAMLAAADSTAKNLLIDLFVLALIVFLLSLRIMLSDWHNKRTCLACRRCL